MSKRKVSKSNQKHFLERLNPDNRQTLTQSLAEDFETASSKSDNAPCKSNVFNCAAIKSERNNSSKIRDLILRAAIEDGAIFVTSTGENLSRSNGPKRV